jgi:hypothetical protein
LLQHSDAIDELLLECLIHITTFVIMLLGEFFRVELLVCNALLESVQGHLLQDGSVFLFAKCKSVTVKYVKAPEVPSYGSWSSMMYFSWFMDSIVTCCGRTIPR